MGPCWEAVAPQQEPASAVTVRATAAYFSLTTSLIVSVLIVSVRRALALAPGRASVVTTAEVGAQQALAASVGAGAQQEAPAGTFSESSQHAPAAVASAVTVQHAVSASAPGVAEHTPVAGSVRSTRRAAS